MIVIGEAPQLLRDFGTQQMSAWHHSLLSEIIHHRRFEKKYDIRMRMITPSTTRNHTSNKPCHGQYRNIFQKNPWLRANKGGPHRIDAVTDRLTEVHQS